MTQITTEAILTKLGYVPNDALKKQLEKILDNTKSHQKIIKHVLDLHEALQVDKSYVAMSNSHDYLKIKIETDSAEMRKEALEKIARFKEKFKVELKKVDGKETYYILGFAG